MSDYQKPISVLSKFHQPWLVDEKSICQAVSVFSNITDIPLSKIVVGGGSAVILHGCREATNDLNLWVEKEEFDKLVEDYGLFINDRRNKTVKPLRNVYVREHNPYYETDSYLCTVEGVDDKAVIRFYNLISLLIHKRRSRQTVERPKEKRDQDFIDIKELERLYKVQFKPAV